MSQNPCQLLLNYAMRTAALVFIGTLTGVIANPARVLRLPELTNRGTDASRGHAKLGTATLQGPPISQDERCGATFWCASRLLYHNTMKRAREIDGCSERPAKVVRRDAVVDRLSQLPNELLIRILTFVPVPSLLLCQRFVYHM